jgi:4-carboxymuconolactone decarboxylase
MKRPKLPSASQVDPKLYARARRLRQQLSGDAYVSSADTNLEPELVPVREVLTELVWGKLWLRPGIDRRTRSFMNIVLFIALNRPQELFANLRVAINNGLTRSDIAEAVLHAAVYCGAPAGVNTIALVRRFFQEEDARRDAENTPRKTKTKKRRR